MIGDIMSLMSVDTMRILELYLGVHMIWTSPLMVIAGVWLLYNQVGPASLAGFATLVCYHLNIASTEDSLMQIWGYKYHHTGFD
jgi:hypothetical protein